MSRIIDKRSHKGNKPAVNRKKFLERYKAIIKERVSEQVGKDVLGTTGEKRTISIPKRTIEEPTFRHSRTGGVHDRVYPGNERFNKGDRVRKPQQSESVGKSAEVDEQSFEFTLSRDEFLNIYFGDMELPDLVKRTLIGSHKTQLRRAGFTRTGVATQLDVKKTLEMAIGRRIAAKANGKESPQFLNDVDLRYRRIHKEIVPVQKAVMFCVMDSSGSMTEDLMDLAKRFFTLLHLFLTTKYDHLELVCIRYHINAREVPAAEFFKARDTGGTRASRAYALMKKIIAERYDLSEWNVYLSQCDDGGNWTDDDYDAYMEIKDLVPKLQYFTYVCVGDGLVDAEERGEWEVIAELAARHNHVRSSYVTDRRDIYPALKELFGKEP